MFKTKSPQVEESLLLAREVRDAAAVAVDELDQTISTLNVLFEMKPRTGDYGDIQKEHKCDTIVTFNPKAFPSSVVTFRFGAKEKQIVAFKVENNDDESNS